MAFVYFIKYLAAYFSLKVEANGPKASFLPSCSLPSPRLSADWLLSRLAVTTDSALRVSMQADHGGRLKMRRTDTAASLISVSSPMCTWTRHWHRSDRWSRFRAFQTKEKLSGGFAQLVFNGCVKCKTQRLTGKCAILLHRWRSWCFTCNQNKPAPCTSSAVLNLKRRKRRYTCINTAMCLLWMS